MTGTFTQPNETTVTFVDEDGYEFALTITNAKDERDAHQRAHHTACTQVEGGDWRPHGSLLISRVDVEPAPSPRTPAKGRYAVGAAWRARAAGHIQGAIAELESAALVMPVSRERMLIDRALRGTAQTFRECTRNLETERRHLAAPGPLDDDSIESAQ